MRAQTSEPVDLDHLATTTPWSRRDWEDARSWLGPERFEQNLPTLLTLGGHPKTLAKVLRSALREPDGVELVVESSPRARRYAEALARSAMADERVAVLTDLLAEHEWHRNQAESELYALKDRVELGEHQLILSTGEAPPEYVTGLIDLTDGRCWVRGKINAGWDPDYWVHAHEDPRHQTRYEWPIGDAGPFIALPDGWHLTKINEAAEAWDRIQNRLHEMLRRLPGYDEPEGRRFIRPDLDAALGRILMAKDLKASEARQETQSTGQHLRALQRAIAQLADTAETRDEDITAEQLRALLPQDGAS